MEGRVFLAQQATGQLTEGEAKRILTLLEAQYYRQAMYTSCGFFFEDLSRLEPRYVIAYAAKAIHLVKEATDSWQARAYTPLRVYPETQATRRRPRRQTGRRRPV